MLVRTSILSAVSEIINNKHDFIRLYNWYFLNIQPFSTTVFENCRTDENRTPSSSMYSALWPMIWNINLPSAHTLHISAVRSPKRAYKNLRNHGSCAQFKGIDRKMISAHVFLAVKYRKSAISVINIVPIKMFAHKGLFFVLARDNTLKLAKCFKIWVVFWR